MNPRRIDRQEWRRRLGAISAAIAAFSAAGKGAQSARPLGETDGASDDLFGLDAAIHARLRANGCWVFKGGDRRYDVYKGNSIVADRLTAREVEQMAYGERGPDGRADSGEGPTSLGH